MSSTPNKQQQRLSASLIYTTLAVGFAALLFLIGLIGTRGASKLSDISREANSSAEVFKERVTVALSIREATAEIIAETRVYRVRRGMRVQIPILEQPFRADLNNAKRRFHEEIARGKQLWGDREVKNSPTQKEVVAWRRVEAAAQSFEQRLSDIENAPLDKPSDGVDLNLPPAQIQPTAGDASQPGAQPADPQTAQAKPTDFFGQRKELDDAAENLFTAVRQVQAETLYQIASQQERAAREVRATRWVALLLGVFFAALTFAIVWYQIVRLREASRLEQNAKDFARSVFNSQSNGIIVVNRNGELLEVNQAFLDHFKLLRQSVTLQNYRAALAHLPDIAAFVGKAIEQERDDAGLRERIEVKPRPDPHHSHAQAEPRLFDLYVSPMTASGQTDARVIVMVDVTEAEQVREELRRSRTLSAVGQITATVAHELYNPIGAVKLNVDLLEMQVTGDDDVKGTVARLKRGLEHLSTIVLDLRYLTRPRDPERKTTDLNKLLDEVIELAGDRLERSRVYVSRKYAPRLPQGQFDPQQLRKVFLNLLINAVEASPQNSDVELQTRYVFASGGSAESNGKRGALVISVIDHGVGMSVETRRRLFEAFYTTKRNGTGLGMMITQEIVKKHGGKIEVESEEGKGTTVNVYLPV